MGDLGHIRCNKYLNPLVGDGCGIVDDATYQRRLEVCRKCDRLSGNRCAACGCFINVKARGRIFRCPLGRW